MSVASHEGEVVRPSHAPSRNSRRLRFSLRSILLICTLACLLLGGIAYFRAPSHKELLLINSQQKFFGFLDSVFATTPGFKSSAVNRAGYLEAAEVWQHARGCQFYGSESRTLETPGGTQLHVYAMRFTVSGPTLQRNQDWPVPIWPVHEPFVVLSEIWNGKEYTRAVADDVLKIRVGDRTVPVGIAKWPDADGSYVNHFAAWWTDGKWIDPFDRAGARRTRVPDLSPRALENGIEMLRFGFVANTAGDEEIPIEVIQEVVEMFAKKLPQ